MSVSRRAFLSLVVCLVIISQSVIFMKKILLLFLFVCAATFTAQAQFTRGTCYVGASLSNLSLNYSPKTGLRTGINLEGGYYFEHNWMWRGNFNFNHTGRNEDSFSIGTGLRYSFYENGLSLGAGVEYSHKSPNINDLRIPVELGYTFYLNHYLAIEPAVYYKLSVNDVARGSEVGLRLGLGYYF